jgi:hypothetical protein
MSTTFNPATAATPFETSTRTLTIAVAAALLGALLILILFVLPAERGIDPTGIGSALGLAQMRGNASESKGAATPTEANSTAAPERQSKQTISKATALRSDDMTVVLKPHTGTEIKALMRTGDHLVFRWEATGPVTMDMHGERPNAGDEFTRYWKEADQTSAQGAFTAPFDGRHGWHWRNRSEKDVTIKVHTVGFYESLIQPH